MHFALQGFGHKEVIQAPANTLSSAVKPVQHMNTSLHIARVAEYCTIICNRYT